MLHILIRNEVDGSRTPKEKQQENTGIAFENECFSCICDVDLYIVL